jgi:hypothetical protein
MIHDRIAIPIPMLRFPSPTDTATPTARERSRNTPPGWQTLFLALPVPFPVVTPRSYTSAVVAEGFLQ